MGKSYRYTGGAWRTHAYLIPLPKTDQYLCFDAPEGVAEAVQDQGIKLAAVVLTHGHHDHVHDLAELVRDHQCPVFLHPRAREWVLDPTLFERVGFSGKPMEVVPETSLQDIRLQHGILRKEIGGIRWHIMHATGHSQDGLVFHLENEGLVIGGDVLLLAPDGMPVAGRCDLPGGSIDEALAGIRRFYKPLKDQEDLWLMPGHGACAPIATIFRPRSSSKPCYLLQDNAGQVIRRMLIGIPEETKILKCSDGKSLEVRTSLLIEGQLVQLVQSGDPKNQQKAVALIAEHPWLSRCTIHAHPSAVAYAAAEGHVGILPALLEVAPKQRALVASTCGYHVLKVALGVQYESTQLPDGFSVLGQPAQPLVQLEAARIIAQWMQTKEKGREEVARIVIEALPHLAARALEADQRNQIAAWASSLGVDPSVVNDFNQGRGATSNVTRSLRASLTAIRSGVCVPAAQEPEQERLVS